MDNLYQAIMNALERGHTIAFAARDGAVHLKVSHNNHCCQWVVSDIELAHSVSAPDLLAHVIHRNSHMLSDKHGPGDLPALD